MSKHLVWDWNGTLLDDFDAVVSSSNVAFSAAGGNPIDADTHRRRFRRPVVEFYGEMVGRRIASEEFAELDRLFHRHYDSLLPGCRLTADAHMAMDAWRGSQSLLSMWFHSGLVPLVEARGLTSRFDRVDGLRDAVGGGGKHRHLEDHLAALNVKAADCVLIGDSVDDADAAHAAGAECVLYTGGFTDADRLREVGVPVVDSLVDAVAVAQQT